MGTISLKDFSRAIDHLFESCGKFVSEKKGSFSACVELGM